jgi:hypothetical protein
MLPPYLYVPEHWRERADAMRDLAAQVNNEELKSILLRLTDEYRQLADRFEALKQ